MTTHIFNYKIITHLDKEEKICRVNFWAQKTQGLNEAELNINLAFTTEFFREFLLSL